MRNLLYSASPNMGNCCDRCFGRLDKRKYLRTRYNVERDFSIEFENLMDDEPAQDEIPNCVSGQTDPRTVLTKSEREILSDRKYEKLLEQQKKLDTEIDQELIHQEEELRQEEEAYYEAKREAARVARQQKQRDMANKGTVAVVRNGPKAWIGDDESDWEIAGGEDDFEMFLESVKARSLAARTRALPAQVAVDTQSTSDDRSRTEASSLDLEWEHEAGMTSAPRDRKKRHQSAGVDENAGTQELAVKPMLHQRLKQDDSASNDLEWDNDFTPDDSEHSESRKLLGSSHTDEDADR